MNPNTKFKIELWVTFDELEAIHKVLIKPEENTDKSESSEKHLNPRGQKPVSIDAVISSALQQMEKIPDDKPIKDVDITGDGLF